MEDLRNNKTKLYVILTDDVDEYQGQTTQTYVFDNKKDARARFNFLVNDYTNFLINEGYSEDCVTIDRSKDYYCCYKPNSYNDWHYTVQLLETDGNQDKPKKKKICILTSLEEGSPDAIILHTKSTPKKIQTAIGKSREKLGSDWQWSDLKAALPEDCELIDNWGTDLNKIYY